METTKIIEAICGTHGVWYKFSKENIQCPMCKEKQKVHKRKRTND